MKKVTETEELTNDQMPAYSEAVKSGMYALPLQATGDYLPFPDQYFASALSNSVLEHIPSIQPVLETVKKIGCVAIVLFSE